MTLIDAAKTTWTKVKAKLEQKQAEQEAEKAKHLRYRLIELFKLDTEPAGNNVTVEGITFSLGLDETGQNYVLVAKVGNLTRTISNLAELGKLIEDAGL